MFAHTHWTLKIMKFQVLFECEFCMLFLYGVHILQCMSSFTLKGYFPHWFRWILLFSYFILINLMGQSIFDFFLAFVWSWLGGLGRFS